MCPNEGASGPKCCNLNGFGYLNKPDLGVPRQQNWVFDFLPGFFGVAVGVLGGHGQHWLVGVRIRDSLTYYPSVGKVGRTQASSP